MTKDVQPNEAPSDVASIRVSSANLADFLIAVLGDKRESSQYFDVIFCVDLQWILSLIEAIEHRISSQNKGTLIKIECIFFYMDGSLRKISSLETIKTFRDLSSKRSCGFRLTMQYLITFNDSGKPEAQDITIRGRTAPLIGITKRETNLIDVIVGPKASETELISRIYYTNVTFGEDMLNLIETQIKASFPKRSRISGWFARFGFMSSPFIISIILLSSIYREYSITMQRRSEFVDSLLISLNRKDVDLGIVNQKIDGLFNLMKISSDSLFGINSWTLYPSAAFLFIVAVSRMNGKSAIIINEATRRWYDSYLKRKNIIQGFIWTSSLALLLSAFGYEQIRNKIWPLLYSFLEKP